MSEQTESRFEPSEDQIYYYTELHKQVHKCPPTSLEFESQDDFNDAYDQLQNPEQG